MSSQSNENAAKSPAKFVIGVAGVLGAASLITGVGLCTTGSADLASGSVAGTALAELTGAAASASEGSTPWPFQLEGGEVRLELPAPKPTLLVSAYSQDVPDGPLFAMPYQYNSRVFERVQKDPLPMGIVRRGTPLRALKRVYGPGCAKGAWYELSTGGYACTRDGFHVTDEPREFSVRQPPPALDAALPFQYAKAERGARRFYRIPTLREERKIEEYAARDPNEDDEHDPGWPEVVEEVLDGAYFVALDRIETQDERRFYRTVRGRYIREQDLELRPTPPMHGEELGERWQLPIGFVHGDEPVAVQRDGEPVGKAVKHARFPVKQVADGVVVGPGGFRLPRERVRIASRIKPPDGVPAGSKWVHVNLNEQTLVAYEGSRPVFATLVSSGLEEPEFATPTGVYRVREKHVSVTMNGPDPDAGRYEVEEVPWTQYYYESYALHGAYWHNDFGRVRSHGCTNLAPTDARWLFHWTSPELPAGWQARRRAEGTYIVLTRDEA